MKKLVEKYFPNAPAELRYLRLTQYSLRINIAEEIFVEVYYNTENQRQSYTLVNDGQRAFGCDNLLGWHYHPRENPENHFFYKVKPSLEDIFIQIKETVAAIGSGA